MHSLLTRSVAALGLLAMALPGQDPKVLDHHGTPLTLPAGWTTQKADQILQLVPPDAKAEESYGLLYDADSKDLDKSELLESLDGAADMLLTGSQRAGEMQKQKCGNVDGRRIDYRLERPEGQEQALHLHVWLTANGGAAAFYALGTPAQLQAREAALKALLGSVGVVPPKPKRAFGLGKAKTEDPGVVSDGPAPENPLSHPPRGDGPKPKPKPKPFGDKPADDQAGAKRIANGTEVAWRGIALDIPQNWQSRASDEDTTLLMPPGFGESGVLEELYALCGDGSIASLDAEDLLAKVETGVAEVQPGMTAVGQPKKVKLGDLDARQVDFTGKTPDGRKVTAVVRVFQTDNGVRALLELGFPQKLQSRAAELQAILGSMRKAAGGTGRRP